LKLHYWASAWWIILCDSVELGYSLFKYRRASGDLVTLAVLMIGTHLSTIFRLSNFMELLM